MLIMQTEPVTGNADAPLTPDRFLNDHLLY